MRFILLISLLMGGNALAMTSDEVIQLALQEKIQDSRQWQKLLHFEPGFLGFKYSQVDSTNFFLADNGYKDLTAELKATIQAFMTVDATKPENERPQCRFPARALYFKRAMPQVAWPKVSCDEFEKYHEALKGVSASLVFSSYYLNNPSSGFGHTFLRINKAPATNGKRYELLDYGVNYAATVDTKNALVYAYKGMFGMFPGNFTNVPYYFKVREYSNSESRDLWEYELNITPAEVDMMIAHMWELGPTYIEYWYLTENCSYHMLTLLEAAAPRLDLVSQLKKWVIPSDTIRVVWNTPGLVNAVFYRPSIRAEFLKRVDGLSKEEIRLLKDIVEKREFSEEFQKSSDGSRQKILDAAMDYMDYQFAFEVQVPGPEADFKNKILSQRSQIQMISEKLVFEPKDTEKPHLSHGSRRIGLGYLASDKGNDYYDFEVKFALHDQLEMITGYPEYAEISFGDLVLSYIPDEDKLTLQKFYLFEIISHAPISDFATSFSWQLKVGVERIQDENCFDCHGAILSGGVGYTFKFTDEPLTTLFAGLKTQVYYTPTGTAPQRFIPGAGPAARLRLRMTENWIALAEAWYRKDYNVEEETYQEYSLATQWSPNKSWGFRLTGKDQIFDQNLKMDLFYYY